MKERLIKPADVLILSLLAALLALPMILYGPMVKGHDSYEHLNYCRNFSEQFRTGEWYPRWLLNMNHGLGSPTFFVYPPFANFVVSFLQPLARVLHANAFNTGEYLALLGSGITGFLCVRTLASRRVALVSSFLYMLSPYHLVVDFYRRNALSECWALVWIPLILYFTNLILSRRRAALIGLAVAYALLIISHVVSALIFSPVLLVMTSVLAPRGERTWAVSRVVAGMTLGVGLSSFYLLPALAHAKYFPVMNLLSPPYYFLESNLIGWNDLGKGNGAQGSFTHWVSLLTLTAIAFLAISGIAVVRKGYIDVRRISLFWLAACTVPVFLMLSVSLPVWRVIPPLLKGVQYPWRFNIVLCVAILLVSAAFLSCVHRLPSVERRALAGILGLIVLAWIVAYGQVWKRYRTDVFEPNPREFVSEDDGWFDAWSAPGTDQQSALRASFEAKARFASGTGTSEVEVWKARQIEVRTNSISGGWLVVNQFYYPKWSAWVVGDGRPLETRAILPEGLVGIQTPPGQQEVRLEIPVGLSEIAGNVVSLGCLFASGLLVWEAKRRSNKTASKVAVSVT